MHTHQITRAFTRSKLATIIKLDKCSTLVLMCIIDHYNIEQQKSWPKQLTIAEEMGVSIRSVNRSIQKLQNEGLIITSITKNGNIYKLTNLFFEKINLETSPVGVSGNAKKSFEQDKIEFSTSQVGVSFMNIEKNKEIEHDHEHNDVNAFYISNDDGLRNLYKKTLDILKGWHVFEPEKMISNYGLAVVNNLVSEIANKNGIYNKGAYFRKSLRSYPRNTPASENNLKTKNSVQDPIKNQNPNGSIPQKLEVIKMQNNTGSENPIPIQKNENNKAVVKCSNCNENGYVDSEMIRYNMVYKVAAKCECGYWNVRR